MRYPHTPVIGRDPKILGRKSSRDHLTVAIVSITVLSAVLVVFTWITTYWAGPHGPRGSYQCGNVLHCFRLGYGWAPRSRLWRGFRYRHGIPLRLIQASIRGWIIIICLGKDCCLHPGVDFAVRLYRTVGFDAIAFAFSSRRPGVRYLAA